MDVKNLFIATFVLMINTACTNKTKTNHLGQIYQGGKIFYIDSTNKHGLIVDTEDLGISNWEEALIKCKIYKAGGFSDWHLPTRQEMDLLYKEKDTAEGFIHYFYWSSEGFTSQEDDDSVYFENFSNGTQGKADESNQFMVRAVRAF